MRDHQRNFHKDKFGNERKKKEKENQQCKILSLIISNGI